MSGAAPPPDTDWLLAAELAFGLLDGDERLAAERRVTSDPIFAAAHLWWREQTVAMAAGVQAEPPPGLWQAVIDRLPANDVVRDEAVHRSLRRWRAGAVAASAAAALLAVVVVRSPAPRAPPTATVRLDPHPLVAVLTAPDGPGVVTVSFDPAIGAMTTAAVHLVPTGRATELWVVPADGRPRSLGVIPAAGPGWPIPSRNAGALKSGVTLAVSLEPVGGSRTGAPTGPVILTGKMRVI